MLLRYTGWDTLATAPRTGKAQKNFPASSQILFVIIYICIYICFLCSSYLFSIQNQIKALTFWCSLGIQKCLGKAKLPAVSRTQRGQPAPRWVCCVQSPQTALQTGQCSSPRTPDGQPATCKAHKQLSSASPTEIRDMDNKWSVTHLFFCKINNMACWWHRHCKMGEVLFQQHVHLEASKMNESFRCINSCLNYNCFVNRGINKSKLQKDYNLEARQELSGERFRSNFNFIT